MVEKPQIGTKMQKKYIIINNTHPVIFPDGLLHSTFHSIPNITSAGFVTFSRENRELKVLAYGFSTTLCKNSKDGDDELIRNLLEHDVFNDDDYKHEIWWDEIENDIEGE
jgi:hypothetical protein